MSMPAGVFCWLCPAFFALLVPFVFCAGLVGGDGCFVCVFFYREKR